MLVAQRFSGELPPPDADFTANPPAQGIGLELRSTGKGLQQAVLDDQLGHAGFGGQRLVQCRCAGQQQSQATGRGQHRILGPAGAQVAQQPGHRPWQVGGADRERSERIHDVAGQLPPDPRRGRRNDGVRRQPAGIAVAGRLFAAGIRRLDDGDGMAITQQFTGAGCADDAGSDDDDVQGHEQTGPGPVRSGSGEGGSMQGEPVPCRPVQSGPVQSEQADIMMILCRWMAHPSAEIRRYPAESPALNSTAHAA